MITAEEVRKSMLKGFEPSERIERIMTDIMDASARGSCGLSYSKYDELFPLTTLEMLYLREHGFIAVREVIDSEGGNIHFDKIRW